MAFKKFQVAELPVTIYKRRSSRSLRLSIQSSGEVRVSIPVWAPYSAGISFAHARLDWIRRQLPERPPSLAEGQLVGKYHRLRFVAANVNKPSVRLKQTEVVVRHPLGSAISDAAVQAAAERGALKALRLQAEQLLPQRLAQLAQTHGCTYRQVSVKRLKSRWGSCDSRQNIVLNFYLMQLPWECIDYVLLHELAHTRVMQHGPKFWAEMERLLPDVKRLRKLLRTDRPLLRTNEPQPVA